jgi:hypothetical protein
MPDAELTLSYPAGVAAAGDVDLGGYFESLSLSYPTGTISTGTLSFSCVGSNVGMYVEIEIGM